jgi:gas vesicle protein
MAKKSGFVTGAVLGILAGAAAALFTAPKKGSELREDAVNAYNEYKDNPDETLAKWKEAATDFTTEKAAQIKDFSSQQFDDIKAKFDSGEISADKAKEFLTEKRDLIKEKIDSGDLSKEKVAEFFNSTKDALIAQKGKLADKFGVASTTDPTEWFDDITDDADEVIDDATTFVADKVEDAKEVVADKAEEVADAVSDAADQA